MSKDVRQATTAAPPIASKAAPSLPDDPVILKRLILELLATLKTTRRENDQLHHRLDQLLRRLYGPRAEKFDPSQPWLFPELQATPTTPTTTTPADVGDSVAKSTPPKKNGHGRRQLPDSLPRVRQTQTHTHTLSEAECPCPECGTRRAKIGE